MSLGEKVKNMIKSWLDIQPARAQVFKIDESTDYNTECIKNQIWYRGDSHELASFYSQLPYADDMFWSITQTAEIRIKRSHTGLPKLLVKTIINTVITDYSGDDGTEEIWNNTKKENNFDSELLKEVLMGLLIFGDGALKINYDPEISDNPILEWKDGGCVDFVYKRGRIREVVFNSFYTKGHKTYKLEEHYGYGYITYKLLDDEKEASLDTIKELKNLKPIFFDKSEIWAIPIFMGKSIKFKGRGESIFTGKYDAFDSLDEVVSQWLAAIRSGRAKTYIPEDLIPRDPETGELMLSNPFDNQFITTESGGGEKDERKIIVVQPTIPTEQYLQSYITFLDMCLQGLVSPSTLGIDNKKLDNAEAQREKEKTTLYTRGTIIDILSDFINKTHRAVINSYNIINKIPLEEVKDINSKFGEYNNPSFEAQIETIGKGKQQGIMSIEASVEELYGDSKDEEWKKKEIERLKSEQGITEIDEPAVNEDGLKIDENNSNIDDEFKEGLDE